jgi:PAS domain S-box-containing protein
MFASEEDRHAYQEQWLEGLPAGQFRLLFEHLPGTLFFAKDLEGHIMFGNPAFMRRCGFETEEELIGQTDNEMFPERLAQKYRSDDLKVMEAGKPMLEMIELFPNPEGVPEWSVTDKLPLFDREGKVCGICGTVRTYEGARAALEPYLELAPVADYIKANFRDRLDVPTLAQRAGMSVRQLERKFRNTFKTSPRAYLVKMRILAACDLLEKSSRAVTDIALEVGFYDHSDFSRQFRKGMGVSPSEFRKSRWASNGRDS